jgi:small subunit ribosomal protein S5
VQQLVPRAAAPEAEAETEDFSFNLSDARKGNEYSPSDVQAALEYFDGEAAAPSYNDEFVANPLGMEDASFFDDIDNNEAYEADEYIVAGIPEAAPKKRRDGRRGVREPSSFSASRLIRVPETAADTDWCRTVCF